ncbi:membrane protein [Arthrobacter phage Berrie]|uniref:Membrane protein n=1 Tax=Arthrobacter phage Berrie TaxID=2926087 RepID=A0ABZ2CMC5_9CAUD
MLTSREPLVIRGAIVAAVTALLHVLIVVGALPITPDAEHAIAGAVDLLGTAVLVVWTRGKVTPVDAPNLPPATLDVDPLAK